MQNTYATTTCDKLLSILKKQRIAAICELAERLRVTSKETITAALNLLEHGYDISIDSNTIQLVAGVEPQTIRAESTDYNYARFAIVSDMHFGSKYQQITALTRFYETAASKGGNSHGQPRADIQSQGFIH